MTQKTPAPPQDETWRSRAVRRIVGSTCDDLVAGLRRRIEDLEAEVQEQRQLNVRVAELTDVVQELLLPVSTQDPQRIREATEKFARSL